MANSKTIGNIGEVKTLSKFVELGFPTFIPFGDNEKCDLISEFNGKLNKIQVKTSEKSKNGIMVFNLVSSTINKKHVVKHIYSKEEIDYFVLYNVERDKLFLLNIEEVLGLETISIRYLPPRNKQTIGIRMEEDYLFDNVIKKLELIK